MVRPEDIRTAGRWASVAVWAAVIFSLSAVPGSRVPGRFGTAAHFIEYAVLAFLLMWALATPTQKRFQTPLSIAIASAYGVTDELHQLFVPMRVADPADWMVDTAGAVAGAVLYLAVARLLRRGDRSPQ